MADLLNLPATTRRAFERLAGDLRRVFGSRLVALVASGPASGVIFVASLDAGDLDAMSVMVDAWHRDGLDTPLVLTPGEFRRSLDAFPVEYQAIIDRHCVITGAPPFDDSLVNPGELRRACEIQAKSHLLHLRQGWIEAAGHHDRLEEVLARSAAPLRALLADVARLHGDGSGGERAPQTGAALAGLPVDLVSDVLRLEATPELAHTLVDRLPEYLAAAERLWEFVDRWRAQ